MAVAGTVVGSVWTNARSRVRSRTSSVPRFCASRLTISWTRCSVSWRAIRPASALFLRARRRGARRVRRQRNLISSSVLPFRRSHGPRRGSALWQRRNPWSRRGRPVPGKRPRPAAHARRLSQLYQPAHQRYYLVSANLVCGIAGLPDRALSAAARSGFISSCGGSSPRPGAAAQMRRLVNSHS